MAASTCDGLTLPEEQADPELSITPSRSSAIKAVSAATPGSAKFEVLARRGARAPKITASGATCFKPASKRSRSVASVRSEFARRDFAAAPKPAMPGQIFGAGAAAMLLPAAQDLRRERRAVAQDQGARALRPAQLVGRKRNIIRRGHGDLPRRLHGIDQQQRARLARQFRSLGDRLHDARFVVGRHQRDQGAAFAFAQHRPQRFEIGNTVAGHRDRLKAQPRNPFGERGRIGQDGGVLDGRDEQPRDARARRRPRHERRPTAPAHWPRCRRW